jgi:hypothetical protein
MSLYVDNVAIYYTSRSVVIIECWLQVIIYRLKHWARQSRFPSPQEESVPTLYTIPRCTFSHPTPVRNLYLNNRALSFAPAVKFLGHLLDNKLERERHLRWLGSNLERSPNNLRFCYWKVSRRRRDSDDQLEDRLRQFRVCLHHEAQAVHTGMCSHQTNLLYIGPSSVQLFCSSDLIIVRLVSAFIGHLQVFHLLELLLVSTIPHPLSTLLKFHFKFLCHNF